MSGPACPPDRLRAAGGGPHPLISPDDALAYAARILQDQLQLFVHFDEGMVSVPTMAGMAAPSREESESDANQLNRYLLKKVDELELSVCSANCLKNDNIKRRGIRVAEADSAPRRFVAAISEPPGRCPRLEIARIG